MIRQLSSRRVYESPYLRLREDAIEQPDGTRGIYGVVEKPDFALVVPWDGQRLHLVGQYRYPVASFEWELPQGGVAPWARWIGGYPVSPPSRPH